MAGSLHVVGSNISVTSLCLKLADLILINQIGFDIILRCNFRL